VYPSTNPTDAEERNMRVKDLMTKTPFCCTDKHTIQHAASLMKSHDVGAIPVVTSCEEGKLLGIITDRDICIKAVATDQGTCAFEVSEVMTKSPYACHADDSIEACEALMEQHQIRRIPVVDDKGICVGIVSQADIALRDSADHAGRTLAAISKHQMHRQQASRQAAIGTA
jgi:CBS domain-containing protein